MKRFTIIENTISEQNTMFYCSRIFKTKMTNFKRFQASKVCRRRNSHELKVFAVYVNSLDWSE